MRDPGRLLGAAVLFLHGIVTTTCRVSSTLFLTGNSGNHP
jgi:hypothetical protein